MRNILPLSQSTFCSWGVDMSWFCSVCEKSFSRKDSMQRHVMSKHRNAGLTPFQTVPIFSQKCQRFRFEHPFTSMIAGMTGSGKTAWVRSLLQQASETIYPSPERIVWWYSQWQCTAISRRLSEKMCTRQSRKVVWDMFNTPFLTL